MNSKSNSNLEHPGLFKTDPKYFNFLNFEDFEKSLINLNKDDDDKGEIFEIFVEAFLKTTKLFNIKSVYASQKNFPNYVFEKLSIPRRDKGIDGVIIDINDSIIPYQVKFRSSKKLDYDELTGFKDQGVKAKEKILFTNANTIGEEYFKRGNNIAFRGVDFNKLNKKELQKINSIFSKKKVLEEDKKIDQYQIDAINNIEKELEINDRTTCLMACGTGKTYVALWFIEKTKPKKIIVFVPSIALLKQIRGDWLSNSKIENLTSFAVCSDKTEPKMFDEIKLKKKDLNFKISTDPNEIRGFINNKDNSTKIIFTTYHSSNAVKNACKNIQFDIGIFDEAHRTTSFSVNNQETSWNIGLLDKNIKIKKRVFFTATQKIFNHRKVDKFGNPQIRFNMNNKEIYGDVCYKLNFYQANKLGAISDYKIIINETPKAELTEELRKRSITKIKNNRIITDQVAHQISLKKAIDKFNLKKIFTFHSRIPQAKSFAKKNKECSDISNILPNFYCDYIEAKMNSIQRENIINKFKKENKALISNARCLIEGVDVPEVDAIAYISPKRSKIDIVQSLGRAVRNRHNPNKKFGYVIAPIFKENFRGETISEASQRSKYDTVAEVLDALRNQDDKLDLLLNEASINYKRGAGFFSKTLEQLSEKIVFLENEVTIKNLKDHIFLKVLETFRNNWDDMLGMLLRYKDEFGNIDIKNNVKKEYKELAKWVHYIKLVHRRKKTNFLKNNQIEYLNKIGFNWRIEGETVDHPNNFKPKIYFKKKYNVNHSSSIWKNMVPVGKYYHGEGGKLIDVYEDNHQKFKKALGIDYFIDELNQKQYVNIKLILGKFFKYEMFLKDVVTNFEKFLNSKKIKTLKVYEKRYVATYGKITKNEISNFIKKNNLIELKNINNFYSLEDIKKKGIYFRSREKFLSKFSFLSIRHKDKKIVLVNAYDKDKVDKYYNKLLILNKHKLNKELIYLGQICIDKNKIEYSINKKFILRYKNFVKKFQTVNLFSGRKGEYVFYKITNIKSFNLCLEIDEALRNSKPNVISKYYGKYATFKDKQFKTKSIYRKFKNLFTILSPNYIPFKHREKTTIYKIEDMKNSRNLFQEYYDGNNLAKSHEFKAQVSKRLKGKKLSKETIEKIKASSKKRKRKLGRFI